MMSSPLPAYPFEAFHSVASKDHPPFVQGREYSWPKHCVAIGALAVVSWFNVLPNLCWGCQDSTDEDKAAFWLTVIGVGIQCLAFVTGVVNKCKKAKWPFPCASTAAALGSLLIWIASVIHFFQAPSWTGFASMTSLTLVSGGIAVAANALGDFHGLCVRHCEP